MRSMEWAMQNQGTTGLKNRWLADNAFQERVRKVITADLLRGLEVELDSANGAIWTVCEFHKYWLKSFRYICCFINGDLLKKIWFPMMSI